MAGRLIERGIPTLSRPASFSGSEYYFPGKNHNAEKTVLRPVTIITNSIMATPNIYKSQLLDNRTIDSKTPPFKT